ncbi:Acetamidase/Formamidase [Pterulicium gracile]|uniref:Acetamidase/Formamidase n=1 Tax=Pterulicium gracile TaxID=1884261 RepID=A0A5C3QDC4_9AGAR|nr:Acetamidase/Formamidase [Pterula gracilis]
MIDQVLRMLISTPPLPELLKVWNECETKLVVEAQRLVDGGEVVPPIAFLPLEKGAYVGAREGSVGFGDGDEDLMERIKNLSKGSRCYFPVYVPGANLSVGDLHFSQGDGEVSFCGAIETAGIITLKTSTIKDGVENFALRLPIFLPSPVDPVYSSQDGVPPPSQYMKVPA